MHVQLWSFLKGQGLRLRSNGSPGPACKSLTPTTNTTSPSPSSLHPPWLAKGAEAGSRGTAEKTRLGRMAFEHRRTASALSETYSQKECTRLHCNQVQCCCGNWQDQGWWRHAYRGPLNMNLQWELATQLCSHLLSGVGADGNCSSDGHTFDWLQQHPQSITVRGWQYWRCWYHQCVIIIIVHW